MYGMQPGFMQQAEADLQGEPMPASSNEPQGVAVHAALHGFIKRLRHPSPVIKEGAPVHHDLQLPTGQGPTPLGPVCQNRQLCFSFLLYACVGQAEGLQCCAACGVDTATAKHNFRSTPMQYVFGCPGCRCVVPCCVYR